MKKTILEAGFTITTTLEEGADFVVVGFDMSLNYETLTIACRLIDRGVPYVATHRMCAARLKAENYSRLRRHDRAD